MGLDMYLKKKKFIGAEYEHNKVEGKIEITIQGKPIPINFNKVSEIIESAGYWRKANAIHNWFVVNCQDGEDNCQESYVDFEQLTELKNICQKILNDKKNIQQIEKLLPPTGGFFFGSTDVDEYFFEDLKDTIKIIEELDSDGDFYYQASW